MKFDEYGEVVNAPETFMIIASLLDTGAPAAIGWTDEQGTHLDLLLCCKAVVLNHLQRGLGAGDLFVSVMSFGAFGFKVDRQPLHPSYVGEKLNLGNNVTTERLTDLINGVNEALA